MLTLENLRMTQFLSHHERISDVNQTLLNLLLRDLYFLQQYAEGQYVCSFHIKARSNIPQYPFRTSSEFIVCVCNALWDSSGRKAQ